jgi:GT2 family glycosyltransferase
MKSKIELSIIIVDYKSGPYLKKLLKALPPRDDIEIIVVDNAVDNRGYGGGCNFGARKAKGKYLLFLNPDVLIKERALVTLMQYLETHPKTGVVGPRYINSDHKTESCCQPHPNILTSAVVFSFINKYFPINPISRKFWQPDWDRETTREIGAVSGAALMVRKKEFLKLGGFDEGYFLYWEECDLCRRYSSAGFVNAHVAEAVAIHPREVSMKQSQEDLSEINLQSRQRYFKKFFGVIAMWVLEIWLA